jgi:hypothetical protein
MNDESHNIPFQVQSLIDNMMDKKEKSHIRDNYRMRLESIRDSIDASLRKYKNDDALTMNTKRDNRIRLKHGIYS